MASVVISMVSGVVPESGLSKTHELVVEADQFGDAEPTCVITVD